MNEKRERQDTYYLSKIYDPVMLYPDGRVGELTKKNAEVKVRLPSRIEGQERTGTVVQSRLAETALHASLADYLVARSSYTSERTPNRSNGWRLRDMPLETLAAYEAWRKNTEPLNLDDVREVAVTKIASHENRLEQALPCPNCQHSDKKYACYSCGYAKEIYKYPLARYHDEDKAYDIPFDAADIIRLNPKALAYKTEWEIDDNGLMSATKWITFDARTIPKEYVTGEKSDDVLTIDPIDDLYKNVAFVADRWAEEKKANDNKRQRMIRREEETLDTYTPESYLAALQSNLALHRYREKKDSKDYNAMISKLHAEVGRRGLELAFEYRYMGMGDSEGRFMTAKRVNEYVVTQSLGGSFNVEIALEDSIERLNKKA